MKRVPYFTRGDLDGFFGLFVDNLFQLMLIMVLCRQACGFPAAFITDRVLPGAALSILIGNLFYAAQARRLARRTGRTNVTALPFGINTVSLLAFIYLVMGPVYYETGDAALAWKAGLAACVISGLIEVAGAFFGSWLRRHTPRAALLSALGGVALSFMALGFSFQVFASPLIAVIPMMLIFIFYGSRVVLPLRLPGGALAIAVGVAAAWVLRSAGLADFAVAEDPLTLGWHGPVPALSEILSALFNSAGWTYIAVVAPIGIFNVINSIQNLDSAEAAGDRFRTRPSLLANGLTTLLAAFFGSPFPTTIYIGHPGWKDMGARTGYSVLNGAVIAFLCLVGGVTAVLKIVPLEVTLGILIWIGIVIVAQAFRKTDDRHAAAVVVGLIPPLAAWVLHIVETSLRAAGTNLFLAAGEFGGELYLHGIISLYQGFLVIAMVFAAILTHVLDRKFLKAAAWSLAASGLSALGVIHAYDLTPAGIQNRFGWMAAPEFAVTYSVIAAALVALHLGKLPRIVED